MSYATARCSNCHQLRDDPETGMWSCECVGVFERSFEDATDSLEEGALICGDGGALAKGLSEDAPVGASFGSSAYTAHAAEWLRAAEKHHRAAKAAQEALEG